MKTISIITPCYNEELNVADCHEAVVQVFDTRLKGYRPRAYFLRQCLDRSHARPFCGRLPARDPVGPRSSSTHATSARSAAPSTASWPPPGDAVLLFLPADLQDPPSCCRNSSRCGRQGYEIVYGIALDARGMLRDADCSLHLLSAPHALLPSSTFRPASETFNWWTAAWSIDAADARTAIPSCA